jgi:hypothetical protein
MALIRGPFTLTWGSNELQDIEEVELEHEVDSEDAQSIQGKTIELDGSFKATAIITLLATDIPALAVVLPQYFVAMGSELSTGEEVTDEDGAIDVVPRSCDEELIYNDLEIVACNDPADVLRIVNARTKIEGIEMDNKLRKVLVKFIGESAQDQATIQFYKTGGIGTVS